MSTRARRLPAVVLIAASLGGCSGYKRIPLGAAPPAHSIVAATLEVGQTVQVQLRGAPPRTITVRAIEADALVGTRGERIRRAQIVAVTRPAGNVSPMRRFGLFCLVILVQALVFALYEE